MTPIKTYIDENGIIYWNKFSNAPAPIPCPFSGNPCSGYCPHNYIFEGFNATVIGFTCGHPEKFEFEIDLEWNTKPENIKWPYGIGKSMKDNKEFLEAAKNNNLKGNFRRYK